MRAIVIDDSRAMRGFIKRILTGMGFEIGDISEACDGQEAIKKLAEIGPPDVALVDWNMPNMNGFELTDAIRQAEPVGSHLPILALTANAMVGEAQRCLEHGMDDYLSKPLRMVDLAPMLEKWLPLAQPQV